MADFSYRSDKGDDLSKVRFALDDTVKDVGPKPDGTNIRDSEITSTITQEGTWIKAVAFLLDYLATSWSSHPNVESDQFGLSNSHVSRNFSDRAEAWRKRYGLTSSTSVQTHYPNRIDAYSTTLPASGE